MLLGGSLLLGLLDLQNDPLEFVLSLLNVRTLVGDLALEVGLEGFKTRDFFLDELNSLAYI